MMTGMLIVLLIMNFVLIIIAGNVFSYVQDTKDIILGEIDKQNEAKLRKESGSFPKPPPSITIAENFLRDRPYKRRK